MQPELPSPPRCKFHATSANTSEADHDFTPRTGGTRFTPCYYPQIQPSLGSAGALKVTCTTGNAGEHLKKESFPTSAVVTL